LFQLFILPIFSNLFEGKKLINSFAQFLKSFIFGKFLISSYLDAGFESFFWGSIVFSKNADKLLESWIGLIVLDMVWL
jgi:hypothetical protein